MPTVAELSAEIAGLAEENRELRARVASLETAPPLRRVIPAAPIEEARAILTYPGVAAPRGLPSDAELMELRRVVNLAYPRFAFTPSGPKWAAIEEREDVAGFRTAFAYLATLARVEKPLATKYATSWWITGCEAWARDVSLPTTIPGRAFIAALVAHGDIAFTALDDYPVFGLAAGDHGRRYAQRWREVLAGRVPEAIPKPGPRPAPPSPSQLIMVGDLSRP
jgi:hypothetical protein